MSIAAFRMLALDQLHESALNPRKSFDAERLAELADSIRTKGVLQPIVARPNADGFEIVCGARRFRAAKSAGLTELPTIVRELTDTEVLAGNQAKADAEAAVQTATAANKGKPAARAKK